jgi:hypothetical protein
MPGGKVDPGRIEKCSPILASGGRRPGSKNGRISGSSGQLENRFSENLSDLL